MGRRLSRRKRRPSDDQTAMFLRRSQPAVPGETPGVPLVAVGVLFARPPRGGLIPVRYTWEWPVYALVGVSLAALVVAFRLGGKIDEIRVDRGSSRGQTVH